MELVIIIGSIFFVLIGVLTALDEWSQHAQWPKKWVTLDRQRRAFIVMFVAAVGGLVAGPVTWLHRRHTRRVRDLLFDLEVLLAQLDGLVSSALAQGHVRTTLGPMQILVGLIGKYGFKAADILSELEERLSESEYLSLRRGAMAITVGINTLEAPRAPDSGETVTSALVNMQRGIRLARGQTRRLINERILQ